MKVLLVDQIAKVNYKYTFPLANGLKKPELKFYWRLTRNRRRKIADVKESICLIQMKKNVGKLEKMQNYIASYKKIGELLRTEKFACAPYGMVYIFTNRLSVFEQIQKKYGVKYVATVHDILPFNEKFYDKYFHKKLYGLADSIILQAPGNVNRFAELFPD